MPETARNPLHRGAATRSAKAVLLCAVALFLILGLILIPLAGIQDDEALFAAPLFTAPFLPYTIRLLGHHLP